MTTRRVSIRTLALAWLALLACRLALMALLPLGTTFAELPFAWLALSDLLVAGVVVVLGTRAEWRGLRLGIALAAIPLAIDLVNVLEAAFFLPQANLHWPWLVLRDLLLFGAVGCLWSRVFGGDPAPSREGLGMRTSGKPGAAWVAGRYALTAFAYAVLYFIAGVIVYPYVREFYATQSLPSPGTVLALQLFLRGPAFAAACLLMLRMGQWSRGRGAIALAASFATISGIAPLLAPNPYFPDAIRWVHFCEVVGTNVVFGALVAALWARKGDPVRARGLAAHPIAEGPGSRAGA